MTTSGSVGRTQAEVESLKEELREGHLNAVRQILPDRVVAEACRRVGHAFRERVLTPARTVMHMIAAALWPDASFKAAWDVVGAEPVESGALSKARNRLPTALLEALSDCVAGVAANVSTPWAVWRGHRVVDTDGTCLSMEDNAELMAEFGTCNTKHGAGRRPADRRPALRRRQPLRDVAGARRRIPDAGPPAPEDRAAATPGDAFRERG